jgi:hypothetical protein
MEDRLNSKDFHRIISIKIASCEETPEWYNLLVAQREICGVLIPPWDILMPDLIMGRYWIKRFLDETIYGRRRTMESHIHRRLVL